MEQQVAEMPFRYMLSNMSALLNETSSSSSLSDSILVKVQEQNSSSQSPPKSNELIHDNQHNELFLHPQPPSIISKSIKKSNDSRSNVKSGNKSSPNSQNTQIACRRAQIFFANPLFLISETKELFLCNDIFIEFNLQLEETEAFMKYKQLQNELRPIEKITHYRESHFLMFQFETTKRGITDFSSIIHRLEHSQDQYLHLLALNLKDYQQMMDFSRQVDAQVNTDLYSQRLLQSKTEMEQFIRFKVPEILKQLDPEKFLVFIHYDMTEGFHNQTRKAYGMNEKYIQMFGSSIEELTSISMKNGWFNMTQVTGRNQQAIEYFQNVKRVFTSGFAFDSVQVGFEYVMLTIDDIQVPVVVMPSHYPVLSNTLVDLNYGKPLLLGLFYILEVQLPPRSKKIIRDIRSARMQAQAKQKEAEAKASTQTLIKSNEKDIKFLYEPQQEMKRQSQNIK